MARDNDRGPLTPSRCPFCDSTAIAASGKITASSYWRCEHCGEVWHPARLLAGASQRRW